MNENIFDACIESAQTNRMAPEFLRLPPPGQRCHLTGLSRSGLNELILPTERNGQKPPVRSFVLRKKGARTGIRLVDYASLAAYIRQHSENGFNEADSVS